MEEEEVFLCHGGIKCIGCEIEFIVIANTCTNCSGLKYYKGLPAAYFTNRPHMTYKSREIISKMEEEGQKTIVIVSDQQKDDDEDDDEFLNITNAQPIKSYLTKITCL